VGHHAVARLEQSHVSLRNDAHAARSTHGRFGAFHFHHFAQQRRNRRVVEVARPLVARGGLILADRSDLVAGLLAVMNDLRAEMPA
jgi:hypothetical protein